MKDLPISKRLLIVFGSILIIFCITVAVSIFSLFSTGGNFDSFYSGAYKTTAKAEQMRTKIQTVAKYVGYSMMETDTEKTKEYIQSSETIIHELEEDMEYLRENFKGDLNLIDSYAVAMNEVKDDREQVFELAQANKNNEATELYFASVMPGFLKANEALIQINDEAAENADTNFSTSKAQTTVVTCVLLVLSALTLLVTIAMARYIIKSITKPIYEIEKAAGEMAAGSLNAVLTYESKDEMGSLADSMRSLMESVKSIVKDVQRILLALADGDFHITSQCLDKYVGDYEPFLLGMRSIRDNLNSALVQISEASDQVAMGSTQLAQNAQGLAEGATEQAGAVEELTATVENVAEMAESSASNAKVAFEEVKASAEKAELGREEMGELIKAMDRISTTSKEIENIIAAIEDIASQTNLLSLNASIEAARAGEAGKGFAVVADQIGKLASDSAQSAVDTKQLINKTLEEIKEGSDITVRTSESFEEVIEEMKRFAQVAKETSDSSMMQYDNLKQVRLGIEQISSVVQSNSAAAEETSATSEELSAQADNLDSQVSRFQLIRS